MTEAVGPLRVVPGSHRLGRLLSDEEINARLPDEAHGKIACRGVPMTLGSTPAEPSKPAHPRRTHSRPPPVKSSSAALRATLEAENEGAPAWRWRAPQPTMIAVWVP